MNNYLVTVLLVTYNHYHSFRQAIESVLEQKTNFEYKIVILDDCSTDGTVGIINEYVSKYPNVSAIIRQNNVGGTQNLYEGLKLVDTKYYAILETDDYWCDINKLETQVNILEENPDCSFCAHNTLIKYLNTGNERNYFSYPTKKFSFPKRISKKYYMEPHTSSRLYRTECLNLDEIKNKTIATYDIATNFYFLTKGNLYYIDKVMSVYNYSGNGIYSGISSYQQRYKSAEVIYLLNKEFDYKCNKILSRFFSIKLNLGFIKYMILNFTKSKCKLTSLYENTLKNYKLKYLSCYDVKPIFKLDIPIGHNKKLALEIKREKVRG